MTEYYVYTDDGERETPDSQPESGYFYEQDEVGGKVTLCQIDPWSGQRVVVDTFDAGESEYLVTKDGKAYNKEESSEYTDADNNPDTPDVNTDTYTAGDERQEDDDPVSITETFGDNYEHKKSSDIYAENDKGDWVYASYEDFPLKIQKPTSSIGVGPSGDLIDAIDLANLQLKWLSRQLGTGDINKPEYLLDPKGDDKHLDDNLDEEFSTNLAAEGDSAVAEMEANGRMGDLLDDWRDIDARFDGMVVKIDRYNLEAYQDVFDKVQDINEAMALSLVGSYKFSEDDDDDEWAEQLVGSGKSGLTEGEEQKNGEVKDDDPKLTEVGIQHVVEELELYEIIRRGVLDCTARVDMYVKDAESLAEDDPEWAKRVDDGKWHAGNDPESEKPPEDGGGDDGGGDDGGGDDGGGDDGGGDDGGGNNGGGNNGGGNNGGGNNGGDSEFDSGSDPDAGADTDTDPSADPDAELAALGDDFSNILGGSDSTPEGSATEDLLGGGEEDKPSSLEDRVMEYINGDTGNAGGGATQAQAPAQPQQAGMDPSTMMMAPLLANAMGGQGPLGGGEKGEDKGKDDDDPRRDQDRQVPGPPQQSPGVPVTADPGVATAQPAVAAPTDTGAPPIVSTPGATVDWPMPGDPETKIKVPQGVSDALTRQQGNPAIDAGTAYAGTPGEQTVEHPWQVVDVSALRTGDVIAWENHSAVVVDNGNGPHYLENGQLVPLNQSNLDNPQYGKFQNYFHPTGLDAAGGTNMQIPEAPTEMPEPKITASQPPEPPPIQGPEQT
ncbi:hypothetical protein ACFWPH_31330 [Nocardia sp. NPDC058499]|uniref:hypothetical protein n=1 Tax=Nocardia sp. NPDC058499 TaxID=3346530 RepID=UPI0036559DAB